MAEGATVDDEALLSEVLQAGILEVDVLDGGHLRVVLEVDNARHDTLGSTGEKHALGGGHREVGSTLDLEGDGFRQLHHSTRGQLEAVALGNDYGIVKQEGIGNDRHARALSLSEFGQRPRGAVAVCCETVCIEIGRHEK